MGQITRWARIGSRCPDVVNLLAKTPGIANIAKAAAGITKHRRIPPFARETFKHWFKNRDGQQSRRYEERPLVIL